MNCKHLLTAAAALAALGINASASTYHDMAGDIFDTGFQHLDITSVTVTNDSNWVYFAIQTAGNLDAPAWGKYMLALDTRAGGAPMSGTGSNGWGRPINLGTQSDFWVGSWADDPGGAGSIAGGNFFEYSGGWNEIDATYTGNGLFSVSDADHASGIQRIAISIAALGLNIGDTFGFDVMTSGGGNNDPGVDHLSVQGQATPFWDVPSTGGTFLQYTLMSTVVIPLPGAAGMALAGMGLIGLRRRR